MDNYLSLLHDTAVHSPLNPALAAALITTGARHDSDLVAVVADRTDLDDATAALIATIRDPRVRTRWLANPSLTAAQFTAALADEDRDDVLIDAAARIWTRCDRDTSDERVAAIVAVASFEAVLTIACSHVDVATRLIALEAVSGRPNDEPIRNKLYTLFGSWLDSDSDFRRCAISTVHHPELIAAVAVAAGTGELAGRIDDLWVGLLAGVGAADCSTSRIVHGAMALIVHSDDPRSAARHTIDVLADAAVTDRELAAEHPRYAADLELAAELTVAARSADAAAHAAVVELATESNGGRRSRLGRDCVGRILSTLAANPALGDSHLRSLVLDAKTHLHWSPRDAVAGRSWSPDDAVAFAQHLGTAELSVHSTDPVESCTRFCADATDEARLEALEALAGAHSDAAAELAAELVPMGMFEVAFAPQLSALCSERLLAALADPATGMLCAEAFSDFDGTLGELLASLRVAYAAA